MTEHRLWKDGVLYEGKEYEGWDAWGNEVKSDVNLITVAVNVS